MRREYDGMTKLSVGNWVYKLSLAISIRLGILPSMMQLRIYWETQRERKGNDAGNHRQNKSKRSSKSYTEHTCSECFHLFIFRQLQCEYRTNSDTLCIVYFWFDSKWNLSWKPGLLSLWLRERFQYFKGDKKRMLFWRRINRSGFDTDL